MLPFTVLIPAGDCARHEIEIAIQSFAHLYHSVTNKHRKRLKLCFHKSKSNSVFIDSLAIQYEIKDAVLENHWLTDEELYSKSSLLLFPASEINKVLIEETLACGLPILGYDSYALRRIVDNSCSMLIPFKSREHNISSYAEILQQLYFDPGARDVLKRGAKLKHHSLITLKQKPELLTQVA